MAISIGVIPGAGYDKLAYWPLVEDAGLIPLSYRRKKDRRSNDKVLRFERAVAEQHGVKHYARRVLNQLLEIDTEVDLLCHSMGWVIAQPLLEMITEGRLNGLVRNVIGLTPAVTGGPPHRHFYYSPFYLGGRSVEQIGFERPEFSAAVAAIRTKRPGFDPRCAGEEVFRALMQSVQGVIPEARTFPKERMFVFYADKDHIIPPYVSRHMLARSGIAHEAFSGYGGHSVPIVDIEGRFLENIKQKFSELSESKRSRVTTAAAD